MSNKLVKPKDAREVLMNQAAKECLHKVQDYLSKAGFSNLEVITVMSSLAKGLQDSVKPYLKDYVENTPVSK